MRPRSASHSGLFDTWRVGGMADDGATNSTSDTIPTSSSSSVEGNIHRGYLNAYARVVRGKIRRIDGGGHHKIKYATSTGEYSR